MYVTAIVLAAGKGLRFSRPASFREGCGIPNRRSKMIESGKPNVSKPLAKINSRPIIIYCLKILSAHPYIKDIVVVVNLENKKAVVSKIHRYKIAKIRDVVIGGRRRQDSVRNGLRALDTNTDLVLIHDGVRPFIDKDTVSNVVKEAQRYGAAIVGVPVKATVKQVTTSPLRLCLRAMASHQVTSKFVVKKTLDRSGLWEIQTPQVFRKDLLLKAYDKFAGRMKVTDDAMLVERLGVKVSVVLGSYNNIKITTPEDLLVAKALLKNKYGNKMFKGGYQGIGRSGFGY